MPTSKLEVSLGATVELPIAVQGAFNLGTLLVEVGYDTGVLELQSAESGLGSTPKAL